MYRSVGWLSKGKLDGQDCDHSPYREKMDVTGMAKKWQWSALRTTDYNVDLILLKKVEDKRPLQGRRIKEGILAAQRRLLGQAAMRSVTFIIFLLFQSHVGRHCCQNEMLK